MSAAGTALQPAGSTDVELTARERTASAASSAPASPPTGKGALGSLPEEDASPEIGIRQRSRRRLRPSEGQEVAQPGDLSLGEGEPLIASAGGLLQVPLEQRPFKQWMKRETVETRCRPGLARGRCLMASAGVCSRWCPSSPSLTSAEINLQQQLPFCANHQMPPHCRTGPASGSCASASVMPSVQLRSSALLPSCMPWAPT